jgi:hypothetical protein
MSACREPATFYDRDLVRHIGVHRVMSDLIDPGFRDDLTRFEFLRHRLLRSKIIIIGTCARNAVFRAAPTPCSRAD